MQAMLSPEPADIQRRLSDPAQLLSDWEHLKASRHHLHNPEAARLLGVPEAALIASKLGQGAIRLPADPLKILEKISQWRRVLVAVHNDLGVSLAIGNIEEVQQIDDRIQLTGAHLDTSFSAQSVANAFWIVEVDENHGRTRSLQFSDAKGQDIFKVFIFHKTAAGIAERDFGKLAETIDQHPFESAEPASGSRLFAPDTAGLEPSQSVPVVGSSGLNAVFSAFDTLTEKIEIETFATRASQRFIGKITHARIDAVMTHLHEPDIRMHLRPSAIKSMQVRKTEGHVSAFEFFGDNGLLMRVSATESLEVFSLWSNKILEQLS